VSHLAPARRPLSSSPNAQPDERSAQPWPSITRSLILQGLSVVIPFWIASRAVCVMALTVARAQGPPGTPWLDTYEVFDVGWFLNIAANGYSTRAPENLGSAAFMPLMPGIMRWGGDLLGGRPILAGLIAANVGALVAALALYVLVRMGPRRYAPQSHRAATLAVAFFLLAPMALPLFIAYTEPLLLAFALPAWIAARKEKWWLAGLLASVSVLARISGMLFAFGIGIMFLLTIWEQTTGRSVPRRLGAFFRPSLVPVLLPLAVYVAWQYRLYQATGIPDATAHALEVVWGRKVTTPWGGFQGTLDNWNQYHHMMTPYEVGGLLVIVGLAVVLAWLRMWPEFALVAASAMVLLCSSLWGSCLRGLEILFPFWLLLGMLLEPVSRRRGGDAWIAAALVISSLGLFWFGWKMATGVLVI
jgi:hypothetical protein